MKNRSYKRKHKAHIISIYHRIKDYNNPRTQNIILYIIYNIIIRIIINLRIRDQGFINPRLGFNKIIESLNQIY